MEKAKEVNPSWKRITINTSKKPQRHHSGKFGGKFFEAMDG